MKDHIRTIEIPIYFSDLIVIKTADINKVLKKWKVNFNAEGFGAVTFRDPLESGWMRYVTVFEDTPKPSLIAHEAFHVVTYLFDDKQIRIDNSNDESAAYLLGWVVNEIHNVLNIKI